MRWSEAGPESLSWSLGFQVVIPICPNGSNWGLKLNTGWDSMVVRHQDLILSPMSFPLHQVQFYSWALMLLTFKRILLNYLVLYHFLSFWLRSSVNYSILQSVRGKVPSSCFEVICDYLGKGRWTGTSLSILCIPVMMEVFAEHGNVSFFISRKLVYLFKSNQKFLPLPLPLPPLNQGKWFINKELHTQFSGPFQSLGSIPRPAPLRVTGLPNGPSSLYSTS